MKISELLQTISCIDFIGNKETEVSKVVVFSALNNSDDVLMWLSEKRTDEIEELQCGTVITADFNRSLTKSDCNYIIVKNPRAAFQSVLQQWFKQKRKAGISSSAIIQATAKIGSDVFIGEHAVIEENCSVGDHCSIDHNTVIKSNTIIGNNVTIGCNCTIGGIGFGYEKGEDDKYNLIPHLGGVIISDNVNVGNNSCIDNGVIENTFIGEGVKIDNLVHIAHGAQIGSNSLIIANAMVGGSAVIGKNVWVAPSASVINKIKIGDDAVIGIGAVVIKDVEDATTVVGNPAKPL